MARRCDLTGIGVQSGNNVSHANNRTRRRFLPNLQYKALHSEALGQSIRLRVSMAGLRTMEKRGGLDAYLLATNDTELPVVARRLKRRIEKVLASRAAAS